ncbi:MAG: SDR family oxidoreductase [Simkaniaceae bacterium]|nr:SDR family oxidoreductase [Simkaniaceae bacterium]
MKVLVTGGAGFIGSHLVELLLKHGHEVIVLDNLVGGRLRNLAHLAENPLLTFFEGDIRNSEVIEPLFEGIDWVFHLAALADIVPSIEMPEAYFTVNVDGTFNVLECARAKGIKRLIYAASSSCYGLAESFPTPETAAISPQYPYALTKRMGEELVLHWNEVYQLPTISLRLFNVFGPRSRTSGVYGAVFGVFLSQKLHGKPLTVVGDGTQTRDFTYVSDVAEAFYQAACSNSSGEIFNVGSGGHYSINQLVDYLKGEVVYIPKRPGEPDCTFADTQKIERSIGWKAKVSFEEGVKNLLMHIGDYRDAPLWDRESIKEATKTWFKHLQQKESFICS